MSTTLGNITLEPDGHSGRKNVHPNHTYGKAQCQQNLLDLFKKPSKVEINKKFKKHQENLEW